MAIRVQHPSGATVEFPEGTDSKTIQKAMRQLDGVAPGAQPKAQPQTPQAAAQPEEESMAMDAAKSLGVGVAQGAIGVGMLPGNLETLGRAGINKLAEQFGRNEPLVSPDSFLPNTGDFMRELTPYTGELYKPKTVAGEYARTVGEFAPSLAFPAAGAGMRAANVIAPAVVSETAGQMTKGTAAEPWARAAGGLVGGMAPSAALRTVTPIPATARHMQAVNRLRNEGVTDLTAGQVTGSKPLRWAESVAQDTPFSGGRAGQMMERQGEQFTRAALARTGIDADRATPELIDQAFTQLGQHFDDIARNTGVAVDRQLVDDLRNVVGEYQSVVPPTQQAPIVAGIVDDLMRTVQANPNAVGMSGEIFSALRSRLSRLASERHSDPQLGQALTGLREALDDAMARTNPQVAEQWQNLRQQYANLLRVSESMAGAGEATAQGLVSPAQLRLAAKTANKRNYVRGRSDLGNLARDAEAVMKPLPNSGTPARQGVQSVMNALAAVGGNSVAGLPGAIGALALPGVASRGLMSRGMQNYLSNQTMAPYINALQQGQIPMRFLTPEAAAYLQPVLTGEQDVGADTPRH